MNTHETHEPSLSAIKSSGRLLPVIVCLVVLTACQSRGKSVVEPPKESMPATAPTVASTTPTPGASPSTVAASPTPAADNPSRTEPLTSASPSAKRTPSLGDFTVTKTPAKATTPTPEPFPPRPTPKVEMVNGKIAQQWQAPAEAASEANPVKDQPDAVAIGRVYFLQRCSDCHGREGKGNGWLSRQLAKPPTNLASRVVQANTDGELFWKITNGKPPMPASRARFTDEQRWYIVTFLRTLK
jgi:mono/diheme cytochrome c family protein